MSNVLRSCWAYVVLDGHVEVRERERKSLRPFSQQWPAAVRTHEAGVNRTVAPIEHYASSVWSQAIRAMDNSTMQSATQIQKMHK